MHNLQGNPVFCATFVLVAMLGLYALNYLVVPGGLTLLGFKQWAFPSMFRFSSQQQLQPTSLIINPALVPPLDATNSTTFLPQSNKPTELDDHEVVMITPLASPSKDLEQSLLTQGFPGATNVSSNDRQESEGERSRGNQRAELMVQGDDDQLQAVMYNHGLEEHNVSTPSNSDLGFQAEETGAWLGLEEHMSNNKQSKSHASSAPGAVVQEEDQALQRRDEKNLEKFGADKSSLSSPSHTLNETLQSGSMSSFGLWLPKVAALLSKCASSAPINILEYLAKKPCPRSCSGHGVCNHDLAICRCFHGYTGAACDLDKYFECNLKYPSNELRHEGAFGPWLPSICPATCNKRKGFCYCGEGTKYPNRPAAEQCGFPMIPDDDFKFNWSISDPDIFTKDNNTPGWCNLDPADYAAEKAKKRDNCFCIYDGAEGELCEYSTQSTCVSQCSGNGFCQNGFCVCEEGWYGIDCSIPSVTASIKTWPSWLSNDPVRNLHYPSDVRYQQSDKVSIERHRPLIYVYDLPPQFNNHLLEGRHFKFHCVNRVYDTRNWTVWAEALYGAENAFLESLLASKHRTNNPEEADFFYVPVLGACGIARAGDSPHMDTERKHYGIRTYFSGDVYYKKAYHHIRKNYPYWNRHEGRDHIWMFPWDEGACVSPKEIWNSMMLVHWGNTNSKYNYSTSTYASDNWNMVPKYWRGNHPCYDPEKDLVLPSWKNPDLYLLDQGLWTRKIDQRPTLFYFRGNLGYKYESGRPELWYSMGIRQRVAEEFGTEPNLEGHVGRQSAPDVRVLNGRSDNYSIELASSRFCGVFPGDGWSGRIEDSIHHGCIPVIIQDGIDLPFENVIDYSKFAVRIAEEHLPLMVDILRSIPEEQVDEMQSVVQTLWQRFIYHNAIRLEADRQQLWGNKSTSRPWIKFKDLKGDDAFDTFIQVLHYKLIQRSEATKTKLKPIQTYDSNVNCYNYSYELK